MLILFMKKKSFYSNLNNYMYTFEFVVCSYQYIKLHNIHFHPKKNFPFNILPLYFQITEIRGKHWKICGILYYVNYIIG